ncbi:MAG: hypothetical protein AB7K24_28035 [Gemmataceae bacterium]
MVKQCSTWLAAFLCVLVPGMAGNARADDASNRPNILFILADDEYYQSSARREKCRENPGILSISRNSQVTWNPVEFMGIRCN